MDGTYLPTIESTAQIIVALTALGINPETDSRFVKNGNSAVDALCSYAINGGGFKHTLDGILDNMATEQGYYALTAYFRFLDGSTSLYDMKDVTVHMGEDHNFSEKPIENGNQNVNTDDKNNNDPVYRPNDVNNVQSPQTGDSTNLTVYFGLIILSCVELAFLAACISKCKEKQE